MKPVQDMTLDECRDEIAVAMGWKLARNGAWHHGFLLPVGAHPCPPTIDSIAASLPPGWVWCYTDHRENSEAESSCHPKGRCFDDTVAEGDIEILARARCCVAAWRKYKENAQ
jgi:hypothetical protein